MVALVARMLIQNVPVDVYVTHLFMSRGDDSLRLFQVQQLLAWIDSRGDVAGAIVCGDFNASLDAPRLHWWRRGSGRHSLRPRASPRSPTVTGRFLIRT